jgi:hypothetical protein
VAVTDIHYPVVLPGTVYEIREHWAFGLMNLYTDARVYDTREAAEQALADMPAQPDQRFSIEAYEPAFVCRCVVCGRHPGIRQFSYRTWDELLDHFPCFFNWQSTSEQLIFCPEHCPDSERT